MLKRRRAAKKLPTPDVTTIRRAMRAKTFRRGLQMTMNRYKNSTLRAVAGQEAKQGTPPMPYGNLLIYSPGPQVLSRSAVARAA